jgi:hypothetical protein
MGRHVSFCSEPYQVIVALYCRGLYMSGVFPAAALGKHNRFHTPAVRSAGGVTIQAENTVRASYISQAASSRTTFKPVQLQLHCKRHWNRNISLESDGRGLRLVHRDSWSASVLSFICTSASSPSLISPRLGLTTPGHQDSLHPTSLGSASPRFVAWLNRCQSNPRY